MKVISLTDAFASGNGATSRVSDHGVGAVDVQPRAGSIAQLRPAECWSQPVVDQNENVAWKKMRRAAEPEEKIPPARLVDLSN